MFLEPVVTLNQSHYRLSVSRPMRKKSAESVMDTYLDIKELARRLGVQVSWIYDRTRDNGTDHIPHYKIGKYVRFLEAEVLEYLKKRSRGGAK